MKMKKFIKEHKIALAIGGLVTVGTMVYICSKSIKTNKVYSFTGKDENYGHVIFRDNDLLIMTVEARKGFENEAIVQAVQDWNYGIEHDIEDIKRVAF